MKQTLVIGSTVADVILSVPRLPGTGEDINITAQTQRLGGCAFNVAGILKLAGIPHTLCSPVGSGLYGDFVAAELEKLGMPCFVRLPDTPNGCCYCLVENSGERTFLCKHGAEYLFSREWMQNADCGRADSAYICGLEIEEECGGEIIAFLQSRPEYTVYFAPGARLLHIPQDRVQAIFDMHPVLHLNETEALTFTAADGVPQAAEILAGKTGNAVIVTLGEKGAYCFSGGRGTLVGGYRTTVRDTIGAGDAHFGAVIAYLKRGLPLEQATDRANRIAAAVVSVTGAALPEHLFRETEKTFHRTEDVP